MSIPHKRPKMSCKDSKTSAQHRHLSLQDAPHSSNPLMLCLIEISKQKCGDLFTKHIEANLSDYLENKLAASQRRILITKWVGQVLAGNVIHHGRTIIRGFKKCVISVAYDGTEDNLINIEGLPKYIV